MAINQTEIVQAAARRIVSAVTAIMSALDDLEVVHEKLDGATIDLEDFTTVIEATAETQHCDAVTYKNIYEYFAPEVVSHLKAFYSGTPTQQGWAAFMKAKK